MQIRCAKKEDLNALFKIESACFDGEEAWSLDALEAQLVEAYNLTLVCENDGQLLGYCTGRMIAPEAELYKIAVLNTYRGNHIGTMLLKAFHVKLFYDCGVRTCYLEVRASNVPAKTLYEHVGYTQVGERKGYYSAPKEDAHLYEITLEEDGLCLS